MTDDMIPDNPCRMSSDEAARKMRERMSPRIDAAKWLSAYREAAASSELTPAGKHAIYWLLPRDG